MWMLFVIFLEADRYYVSPQGPFPTEEVCIAVRDGILSTAPEPKINYEVVCVETSHNIGGA